MKKFNVGDKVISLEQQDGNSHIIGKVGIVISKEPEKDWQHGYYILYDEYVYGHAGNDGCIVHKYKPITLGHCWYVESGKLKLSEPLNLLNI